LQTDSNVFVQLPIINPAIKYTNNAFSSCHSREGGNPGNTMSYGFRLSPGSCPGFGWNDGFLIAGLIMSCNNARNLLLDAG
jgi:hypothetical protein